MLCIILALVAAGVALYPLISNLISEANKSLVETKYEKAVQQMDTGSLERARLEAEEYNKTLLSVTSTPYTKAALQSASESYDRLLNVRGDGIMGYVEIPVLGVELPIFHGTDEATLDRGIGHLLGSSLPVGGLGTHCVLTGHSGLAGQKMFSDLNKTKKGDIFYLKVLNETLAYMVTEINTVLPEDTSKLAINSGKDYCTLLTCTPYGVNTHRLLVRGERIEYMEAKELVQTALTEEIVESTWTQEYMRGIGLGLVGIGGILGIAAAIQIFPKKSKKAAKAPARKLTPEEERQRMFEELAPARPKQQQKSQTVKRRNPASPQGRVQSQNHPQPQTRIHPELEEIAQERIYHGKHEKR